jgi:hypothetical protein
LYSTTSENKRTEKILHGGGVGTGGPGSRRMNMVQIMYTLYVDANMIPVETVPRIKGGGMKESSGEGEFKYNI